MNTNKYIKVGIKKSKEFEVKSDHTTNHVGSGTISVLATPAMIAYMEITSNFLLQENLPEGFSNVGTTVNIRHIAPTNPGSTVTIHVEVLEVNGDAIEMKVAAYHGETLIGDGLHGRHIIDNARFMKRLKQDK